MPANVTDAKEMLISSDYPMDKVIYLKTGSFTMTAAGGGLEAFPHGLPTIPLVAGYWSTTSDFSIKYEFGTGIFPSSDPVSQPFDASILLSLSDATDVTLIWQNLGSSFTAYYRVYGFEAPDSEAELPALASSGDDFVINTDYNYMKLFYDEGIVIGTTVTTTVTHDLGYEPVAEGWVSYASSPDEYAQVLDDSTISLRVTPTTAVIENPFADDIQKFYLRIYLDE